MVITLRNGGNSRVLENVLYFEPFYGMEPYIQFTQADVDGVQVIDIAVNGDFQLNGETFDYLDVR